jgi:hypothetical protein
VQTCPEARRLSGNLGMSGGRTCRDRFEALDRAVVAGASALPLIVVIDCTAQSLPAGSRHIRGGFAGFTPEGQAQP